jgi:carboxypeptidase PM20D1
MAHMDVVPLGAMDVWSYPAFDGRIAEGYIWGRGAIDDKNNVLAILETAEVLLSRGFQPQRSFIFAFGHDEEISGTSGAAFIASHLKSRGIKAEFVLDEGFAVIDGIMPGITGPVALVGTEEKGAFNMQMNLRVVGGHASMPPPSTAIGRFARAIKAVEDNPMPAKITGAVRDMFDTLAPEMSLPFRTIMSNRWLFEKVLLWVLAQQPTTAATVRTTRAATIISSGTKSNVLPSTINATWSIRSHLFLCFFTVSQ